MTKMIVRTFKDAPWWKAHITPIGEDKTPLVTIDNFFPQPEILLQDAAQKKFTANAPYYPGVRATTPQAYFKPLMNAISDVLVNVFGYNRGVDLQECHYSIVTTPSKDLNMLQRIPHIDGGNDYKVALLHYLCGPEHGGTAFYRQVGTSFESVKNSRFETYKKRVETDHKKLGPPKAAYFNDSDERFTQINKVDAKFNRAVLYYGIQLHSVILGDAPLTQDVSSGRLTVNSFFSPL